MRPPGSKADVRLPRKGNSNSHGVRPVHLIITKMKWIRTSRLSIKKSRSVVLFSLLPVCSHLGVWSLDFGFWVLEFGVWSFDFALKVENLGVEVQGLVLKVWGLEFQVEGLGFGFRVSGLGLRVWDSGLRN